jgi:hypothetical protein
MTVKTLKIGRKTLVIKIRPSGRGTLAVFDPKEPARFITF